MSNKRAEHQSHVLLSPPPPLPFFFSFSFSLRQVEHTEKWMRHRRFVCCWSIPSRLCGVTPARGLGLHPSPVVASCKYPFLFFSLYSGGGATLAPFFFFFFPLLTFRVPPFLLINPASSSSLANERGKGGGKQTQNGPLLISRLRVHQSGRNRNRDAHARQL